MNNTELEQAIAQRWPGEVRYRFDAERVIAEVICTRAVLVDLCRHLFVEWDFSFAGLIVEEDVTEWHLRYLFYGGPGSAWVHVVVNVPLHEPTVPTIVRTVHAADWHEREAEDLFGMNFEGHPRLGDFVLHDDAWQEGVEPMRHRFSAQTPVTDRRSKADWRPHRVVQATGAFVMPIGPVFAGLAESVHFALETVGEDVIRALPRLFYKYRGIEKLAEGQPVDRVLLLAERFAATTAFAHGWAFSRAVETICGAEVPARAEVLRVFVAELERFRHHVGAIHAICESTALVVAASQTAMLEEDLLRVSGALTGHRYLFGLVVPGGLATDLDDQACRDALQRCQEVLGQLNELEGMLRVSSSFLDRLEEVGFVGEADAREAGLVGPVARASGVVRDLRQAQPYGGYERFAFEVPAEREGDGYARLRILFAEARQSVRLMEQAAAAVAGGPVVTPLDIRAGAALGYVEVPRGATFHWVRLHENGTVLRYRIVTPSFINWLGFHLAVERFAFQDFPIILSTLDLSVAETDR
jgi:formate hydrogenlyase subunit 5